MDFSKILEDWERRGSEPRKASDDWKTALERYLPPVDDSKDRDPVPQRRRLDRIQHPIEDTLDLHGMTQDEALVAVKIFLNESRQENLKKVLIIHGKGLHSQKKGGILKHVVWERLKVESSVEDFGEADKKDGGNGAVWVWLKPLGRSSPKRNSL